MPDNLILAVDQGTNSTRAILFNQEGDVVFQSAVRIGLNRIDSVRVEQEPAEILESARGVIRAAIDSAPPGSISSIGIATQRSSLLAFERSGRPLSPVLSWQDRRAIDQIDRHGKTEPEVRALTGLPLSPHYGATKFRWLLDNNKEVQKAYREKNLRMGPLVSYLLAELLDNRFFAVDHANASRTLLMNLRSGQWDKRLLDIFSLEADYLPACRPTCFQYGTIQGIPVTAVSGDQNAAFFSEGQISENAAIVNAGTGAFVLLPVGKTPVIPDRLLAGLLDSTVDSISYSVEGTVNGAASAVAWAIERLNIGTINNMDHFLAGSRNPAVFFNSVGGLGSPFWRSGGEPLWISIAENPADALAGVFESIIFLLKINLDQIADRKIDRLIVSGGVSSVDFFCQGLADFTGIPVERLEKPEATARGIAFLSAGRPVSWKSLPTRPYKPRPLSEGQKSRFAHFHNKIYENP